jgi:RecG-like helicase
VAVERKSVGRLKRLTTSVDELDRAQLITFCDECNFTPMTEIVPRTEVRVGGEVRSVRMVPRAGAPALEVTLSDGRGSATAVFLGRRKIAGIVPGRRMAVEGIAGRTGNRFLMLNPIYTLFP